MSRPPAGAGSSDKDTLFSEKSSGAVKEMAFRPISSPRFIRVSRSFPEDASGRPVRLIPEIFIGFFRSRTVVCRPSCRAVGLRLVRNSFLSRQKPIYLHCARLIRIFDFVLDTPSRHNQADACFCARLFVSLRRCSGQDAMCNRSGTTSHTPPRAVRGPSPALKTCGT